VTDKDYRGRIVPVYEEAIDSFIFSSKKNIVFIQHRGPGPFAHATTTLSEGHI
jgi:hypothetical protein